MKNETDKTKDRAIKEADSFGKPQLVEIKKHRAPGKASVERCEGG